MAPQADRGRRYTRLSRRSQVTIPGTAAESLDHAAGTRAGAVAKWSGTLNGVYEAGYLHRLRDEWP
jgi:hypothetical protein